MSWLEEIGAAGAALLVALAQAVAPAADMTIAEWAEGTVVIPPEANTPKPGPLSFDGFEYCIEPLNRLSFDDPCSRVTIKAAGQTGKSNIGVAWFAHTAVVAPRPMGLGVPSGPKAQSFNSKKIQPVIDATPVLRERIVPPSSRDERSSTTRQKNYPGGSLTIFSAGSVNDLQSESFGALWLTETPNFLADIGGRGSPVMQARVRMDGWEVRGTKELHESTPGEEGHCPVSADFEAGDQRLWFMPCPHCDQAHTWEWEDFKASAEAGGTPYIIAPCCGSVIEERSKKAMVKAGVYLPTFRSERPENPAPGRFVAKADIAKWRERDVEGREPSYRFWQILSPLKTWSGIAQDWRLAKGKPAEEAAFRQQKLGLETTSSVKAPDEHILVAANEVIHVKRGAIPPGTCWLSGQADIQGDRIEWAAYAHGPTFMARIDRGVIEQDPLEVAAWAELAKVVARRYEGPHVRPLGFDVFGVDSGGQEGVTPRVYEFTRAKPNVYAIKGSSKPLPSGLPTELKRIKGKDTRQRTITVELLRVDGYIVKRFIAYGLQRMVKSAETGVIEPGAILFEEDTTPEDFRQLTAEVFRRAVDARPGERGAWERVDGRANEQLDLAVYGWALAYQKRLQTWEPARWETEFAARARLPSDPAPTLFDTPTLAAPEPTPIAETAPNPGAGGLDFFAKRKGL